MKPMIDQAFWSDPDIEASKAGVKLAALWLITNSQTSLLGLCGASENRFVFETGLPAKALGRAVEALPRAFVRFGGVIFVRNYIRHQFGIGEKLMRNNFFVALKSLFLSVKDEALKAVILEEYPEFHKALTKPLEGLTKPKDVQDVQDVQGREEKEKGSAEGKQKSVPTLDEAVAYGGEIKMDRSDVEAWFDHFESNGWRVSGKTVMKDWRAALRNGNRRKGDFVPKNGNPVANELSKYKRVDLE
jgi:hypothetical protein